MKRGMVVLGAVLGAALAFHTAAVPARAAFEMHDASPAALGAASTDGVCVPSLDGRESGAGDPSASVAHGSLFGAEGLVADRIALAGSVAGCGADLAWHIVRGPGVSESSARATLRGRAISPIALQATVERLDLSIEEEPHVGGWALGAGGCAAAERGDLRAAAWFGADRILHGSSLSASGVGASFLFGAALSKGGITVAFADRWDEAGRRSPRLILGVPFGSAATVRFARGTQPGRVGIELRVRAGRLAVAAGRLDHASGGAITATSLEWRLGPAR